LGGFRAQALFDLLRQIVDVVLGHHQLDLMHELLRRPRVLAQNLVLFDEVYLSDAGFRVERVEPHDEALLDMVNQVRTKLLGAEIMVGLKKLELPGVDFAAAKQMARSALSAVQGGTLGTRLSAATCL